MMATKFRKHLGDHLNRAEFGGERVIVTRNGRRSAALVSVEDLELLQSIEDRIDISAAREAIAEAGTDGWLTWEDVVEDSLKGMTNDSRHPINTTT